MGKLVMNVCFVVLDLDHYKYAFSDRNEYETMLVLDKKFSIIREIAKKAAKGNEVPVWIYKLTLWLMSKRVDVDNLDVLVVTDLAQKKFPKGYIKWLKQKYPSLKTVMMFCNKVSTLYGIDGNVSIDELIDEDIMLPFDKIYSYDAEEAEKFNFEFFTVASDLTKYLPPSQDIPYSDVFFCGSVKHEWKESRFEVVDQVYQYLTANHVKCDFHVIFSKNLPLPKRDYVGTKRLSYLETVEHSVNARTILEIIADGQNGVTERFYNALMYNKKFLTNNKSALHHPYFDQRFMKVFDDPSEIDIAWLLNNETVEYDYDGKYTPREMYNMLKEL